MPAVVRRRRAVADEALDGARHHHGAALDLRRAAHRRRRDVGPPRPQGLAVLPHGVRRGGGARRRAARANRGEACIATETNV